MRRESGIAVVGIVAALALLVAVGAGYFALRSMSQIDRLESELDTTKGSLNKARIDLKKAEQDVASASKEAKDLKVATERLTTERDAVRATIEKEQANGERLRAELALAKDQVSYLSARTSKDVVKGMPRTAASK